MRFFKFKYFMLFTKFVFLLIFTCSCMVSMIDIRFKFCFRLLIYLGVPKSNIIRIKQPLPVHTFISLQYRSGVFSIRYPLVHKCFHQSTLADQRIAYQCTVNWFVNFQNHLCTVEGSCLVAKVAYVYLTPAAN